MYYSNAMKVLDQLIYLGSAGNRQSEQILPHGYYRLPLLSAEISPLIQSAFT
jgi:hypothetical protein